MRMSACLPGSMEPMRSARQMAAAPLAQAAEADDQLHIEARAGAGVEVRRHGDRNTGLHHILYGRVGRAQIKACCGQAAGDRAALCHGRDA